MQLKLKRGPYGPTMVVDPPRAIEKSAVRVLRITIGILLHAQCCRVQVVQFHVLGGPTEINDRRSPAIHEPILITRIVSRDGIGADVVEIKGGPATGPQER